MIRYEVTLDVDPAEAPAVEAYLRTKHIPEILATGCFQAIRFQKASGTRFRSCYEARGREDLERYLRQHTAAFREDFLAHFPSGCTVDREVWEDAEAWERS